MSVSSTPGSKQVIVTALFLGAAFAAMWWVSTFAEPLIINPSLPQGAGAQSGWPLPYSGIQWVEVTPGKGGYNEASWSGVSFVIDVLVFYLAVNLIALFAHALSPKEAGTFIDSVREHWPGVLRRFAIGAAIVLASALLMNLTVHAFIAPGPAQELPSIAG